MLPDTFTIRHLVTVVAGLNGSGKSRLLRAINDDLGSVGRRIAIHELASWLVSELAERDDLPALAEETGALDVDPETISAVGELVRRDYQNVAWYALSLDTDDSPFSDLIGDGVVPYFEVEHGSDSYSMLEMGQGELAAHILMWTLWYLRDTRDIVLLLDEPDVFLPPASRETLLDYFVELALGRAQLFVIATHSMELIEPAAHQPRSLAFLMRAPGHSTCYVEDDDVREVAREYLYRNRYVRLLAFVEDESAAALASELLKAIDPSLWRRTALYWCQGTGDLEALRGHLPRPPRHRHDLEFILIADGDQTTSISGRRWPYIRLPGAVSPDELFAARAAENQGTIARELGKTEPAVRAIVENLHGVEHHRWTERFVSASDVDRTTALRALSRAALNGVSGKALVQDFMSSARDSGLDCFRDLPDTYVSDEEIDVGSRSD